MSEPNNWIHFVCTFCDEVLAKDALLSPRCECEGFKSALEGWLESYVEPNQKAPREEYNKRYPIVFESERLIFDEDSTHKIKLEARSFDGREAVTVCIPIPQINKDGEEVDDTAGYAWDCTKSDARALYDMLREYLKK